MPSRSWAQYIPVIPALGKLTREDCKFEASLGNTVRSCHKRQDRHERRKGGKKGEMGLGKEGGKGREEEKKGKPSRLVYKSK